MSVRKARADVTRFKRRIKGVLIAMVFAVFALLCGLSMLAMPVIGAIGLTSVPAGGAFGWIVGGLLVSAASICGVGFSYDAWIELSRELVDLEDALDREIQWETDRILNAA